MLPGNEGWMSSDQGTFFFSVPCAESFPFGTGNARYNSYPIGWIAFLLSIEVDLKEMKRNIFALKDIFI